jgi:hypothetical protein
MREGAHFLPRHTGEVPPQGAEGESPKRDSANILICNLQAHRLGLSPSGPAGHLPRMTGEEYECCHA